MAQIRLTIDGIEIQTKEDVSVLEAARGAGIYIPNLCADPDLEPYGACRLCLVEIEGVEGLPTSCTMPAAEGMVVRTDTERVNGVRRHVVDLLLSDHPAATFAEKDGTFTNTERRVQRIRKAIEPVGNSMPDWWITCELAKRMGAKGFDFDHPSQIMEEIAALTPSYGGISYARLEGSGLQWPCSGKDHAGTPILHVGSFTRGKGKFTPLEYKPSAELPDEEYPILLTTARSLQQYHTGTMTRKVDGAPRLVASCVMPVRPGMDVVTSNERIIESRRTVLEFLFAERNHNCMFCPQSGDCELQKLAYEMKMDHLSVPFSFDKFPTDVTSETMVMDHNRCILCGRCVRACGELAGNYVLNFQNRGPRSLIGLDLNETREGSTCCGCGLCLQVCPTGAITTRFSTHYAVKGHLKDWQEIESFCPECGLLCPTIASVKNNRALRIAGKLSSRNDRPDRALSKRGLVLLGEEKDAPASMLDDLGELDFLAVLTPFFPEAIAEKAHVLIPKPFWMEEDGTYTSLDGREIAYKQRILEPPEGVQRSWRTLLTLANLSGVESDVKTWNDLRDKVEQEIERGDQG